MGSDNPDGAENQQERLIQLGWVIGFVDGEGCFSIGFIRQSGGGAEAPTKPITQPRNSIRLSC